MHPRRSRLFSLAAATLHAAFIAGCGSDGKTSVDDEPPGPPEPFTVLTYNVLCSFCGGSEYDTWDERLAYFQDIFARYDADLMGLQELSFGSEVDLMLGLVDGYDALYFKDPESTFTYPDATILYRTSRFEVLDSGFFWLSPTPDIASSTGFAEQQIPRLVTWAKLRDKRSRRPLYFASTHVDNNSPSQEKSAPLILERAEPWTDEAPVVLLGDFNSKPATVAYQILTTGTNASFHFSNTQALATDWSIDSNESPAPAYNLDDRIDHIFVGDASPASVDWQVASWKVDIHTYGPNARYASDHFPMAAEILATPIP